MKITLSVKSKDSNDLLTQFFTKLNEWGIYYQNITGMKVFSPYQLHYLKGLDNNDKEGWNSFLKENKNKILSVVKSKGIVGCYLPNRSRDGYAVQALKKFFYNNGYKYCVQEFYGSDYYGFLNKEDAKRVLEMYREEAESINPNNVDRLMRSIKTKNL